MDIQHLVDRMEDLIDEGRHIPGTKFTIIDEERALELIDQMRISIPEEIEKSTRVLAHRDRVLAEANEQATRLVEDARKTGEQLLDRETTIQTAQARAQHIIAQAKQEANRITAEADQYVVDLLGKLETQITRNLNEVRNGINYLQEREYDWDEAQENDAPQELTIQPQEVVETELKSNSG